MINRVVLVGRLTRDPELRRTSNDIPVVSFTVAVNRPYAKADSDQQADFINCSAWRRQAETVNQYLSKGSLVGVGSAWRRQAETVNQYLSKGSLVGVEGRIQTRNYEDANGNKRTATDVVADSVQFLEPKGSSGGASRPQNSPYDYQSNANASADPKPYKEEPIIDIPDDDLPF